MPSSTSSSDRNAVRLRALRATVLFGTTAAALFGTDTVLAGIHRGRVEDARRILLAADPGTAPHPSTTPTTWIARSIVRNGKRNAVVFAGNSVLQTSTCPPVLRRAAGIRDDVEVPVLALHGTTSATVLDVLLESRWRPRMLVLDLAPMHLGPVDRTIVQSVLDEGYVPPWEGPGPAFQVATRGEVERLLHAALEKALPSLPAAEGYSHFRDAALDGWRSGRDAYLYARWGGLASLSMVDGSYRVTLMNRTPAYALRREREVERSRQHLRESHGRGAAPLDALLEQARVLQREGTRVLLVDMPLDPDLRRLDLALNADRYRAIERQASDSAEPGFLDLGADPVLAALPFYDGHHREYPVARQASSRIGELLAAWIPADLRKP